MKEQDKLQKLDFSDIRLKGYYYITGLIPVLLTGIFVLFFYFFSDYFKWIFYPELFMYGLIFMMCYHSFFFILSIAVRKIEIWEFAVGIAWVAFFAFFITITGGTLSPISYLLVFPLIISLTALDERVSRRGGFVVAVIIFFLYFFNDPSEYRNPSYISLHVLHLVVFSVFGYFLHKVTKDTLRQKFEKEEIQKQLVEREGLNRVKDTFLRVMSHQLNTPLARVRWMLSGVLEEKDLTPERRNLLENGLKSVEESIDIIHNVLESSEENAEKYKMAPEKEDVELGATIQKVLSDLKYLIDRNDVKVYMEGIPKVSVKGDKDMLHIAFTNLLDNAIRYSPHKSVTIHLKEEGEKVIITITDTGVGIDPADTEYIFDKFFRGKNAISMFPNESGVGLYITKQIIVGHRGSITFVSEKGKGTIFTIELPRSEKA